MERIPLAAAAPTAGHVRQHRSMLAIVEARVLVWVARRLPAWVSSDLLTAIGAVAMFGAGAAFACARLAPWSLAAVPPLLALNWFGDSLDGTVARVRARERPRYGFYIDHVVDVVNAVALFAGMAISGLMNGWIAAALLVGYLLLCAESFLAAHTLGIFRLSFSGWGPTELRLLLSAGALAAIAKPDVHVLGLAPQRLFDVGGLVGAAGMFAAFAISAAGNARALARAEPLPGPR